MPNRKSRSRFTPKFRNVPPAKTMLHAKPSILSYKCMSIAKPSIPHFGSSDHANALKLSQALGQPKTAKVSHAKILLKGRSTTLASSVLPKPVRRREKANTFLSVLSTKTKCGRKRKTVLECNRRRVPDAGNESHLAQGKRLRLLQSLFKEPLTYLELHKQFGLSKQILAGLVRNGLLEEVWGKSGVGLKFKITDTGKKLLTMLEESASYDPHIKRIGHFRLNQQIFR